MARMSTSAPSSLDRIGVGIDTARYGHRVSFLRPDRQPAAKPITVMETQAGYQSLREQLERLQGQHPQANFHVRIDAAGQYAVNLERFLRGLALPLTISIGEPKRNKDYQKAHFPKRTTDDTESQAMARFAVTQVCHCQQAEQKMRDLLATAFADLPASGHRQRITIPGIGAATAAVLAAKIIDIDASVPCTPNPMIASRPCRSTSARICFTAFTRNAPPRATSWICGLPSTTYRFTKPRCIWPKPSTCSPTEKRHPYRHPLEKRTMARTQFTVPSSP